MYKQTILVIFYVLRIRKKCFYMCGYFVKIFLTARFEQSASTGRSLSHSAPRAGKGMKWNASLRTSNLAATELHTYMCMIYITPTVPYMYCH